MAVSPADWDRIQPGVDPRQRYGAGAGWSSALDPGHLRFLMSIASRGREIVQPVDLLRTEFDPVGSRVLLYSHHPAGTRDGSDVVALSEEPGQGNLSGGSSSLAGDCLDFGDDAQIAGEVLANEPRVRLTPVVVGNIVHRVDLTSKESMTQGRVGHEADAEFTQECQQLVLGIPVRREYSVCNAATR